jgi:hypothetical protein
MTHFTRLIELTSADETYVQTLAQSLAPCILRPRVESSLTMEEKHAVRLVRDLFQYKTKIFNELKRASSLQHSQSVAQRPRAVSTDESNRKANMEARTRAILANSGSRSRATSPAAGPRGHRRDRSSGGPETRFPVKMPDSPSQGREREGRNSITAQMNRISLEVPGSDGAAAGSEGSNASSVLQPITNGAVEHNNYSSTTATENIPANVATEESGVEKRNSLGRSGHVASAGNRIARKAPGTGSLGKSRKSESVGSVKSLSEKFEAKPAERESRGVELVDKPMDD